MIERAIKMLGTAEVDHILGGDTIIIYVRTSDDFTIDLTLRCHWTHRSTLLSLNTWAVARVTKVLKDGQLIEYSLHCRSLEKEGALFKRVIKSLEEGRRYVQNISPTTDK